MWSMQKIAGSTCQGEPWLWGNCTQEKSALNSLGPELATIPAGSLARRGRGRAWYLCGFVKWDRDPWLWRDKRPHTRGHIVAFTHLLSVSLVKLWPFTVPALTAPAPAPRGHMAIDTFHFKLSLPQLLSQTWLEKWEEQLPWINTKVSELPWWKNHCPGMSLSGQCWTRTGAWLLLLNPLSHGHARHPRPAGVPGSLTIPSDSHISLPSPGSLAAV